MDSQPVLGLHARVVPSTSQGWGVGLGWVGLGRWHVGTLAVDKFVGVLLRWSKRTPGLTSMSHTVKPNGWDGLLLALVRNASRLDVAYSAKSSVDASSGRLGGDRWCWHNHRREW